MPLAHESRRAGSRAIGCFAYDEGLRAHLGGLIVLDRHVFDDITSVYVRRLQEALSQVDQDALFRVHARLCAARDGGHTVYIAGNGGSAATASHWANDLGKATKRSGHAPIRVMSLSDNTAWFSSLANDEGYEAVFAGQLDNFAQPGDVLVAISASGKSPNLLKAIETARSRSVSTIGFVGFDGGHMKSLVDEVVWVPSEGGAYELVEDAHMAICHVLTRSLVSDTGAAIPR